MACMIAAIATGFILHKEVHHLHITDDDTIWCVHELIGLLLMILVANHCVQHKFWFKNYAKISARKKHVSTILLAIACIVLITGLILWSGVHSHFISLLHYAGAILFVIIGTGHVIKRWRLFRSLK